MLLFDKIIQISNELSNCKRLILDEEFFINGFRFQSSSKYLFISSFSYQPINIFQSKCKRLQLLILEFFLIEIHYLNCYKVNSNQIMIAPIKSENDSIILDPILLLTQQLKEKNLKKQALQQIGTIAITLTPARIRQQLVPLLIKTFVQQNLEIRISIVKSFAIVLEYLDISKEPFVLLEFILDILCVFSEQELRKQAYQALQTIMHNINLRKYQGEIIKTIKELSNENEKIIKQLVLKLVRYVYIVVESENQTYLLQVLSKYKENEEDQLLLAQELSEFIKIVPPFPEVQISNIIKRLLKSTFTKVRSKLIEPIILLAKISDEYATKQYFERLLKDDSTDVAASLVLQIRQIQGLTSKNILNQVSSMIDDKERHDNTMRSAILEVLQHIPLTKERRAYILETNNFKSLSLSKALADSLCKIHDTEALAYLIETSDTEFKNKLFPKLPSVCQIHLKLMEHIFNQKNWRIKLTLLQNIEKRMQNQENVQIFIYKLLEQLGDKIGVLRMNVVRLIALIIKSRKIQLKEIANALHQSLQSSNWFERQSVLLLMEYLSENYSQFDSKSKSIFRGIVNQGVASPIRNIRIIAQNVKNQCYLQ